MRSLSILLASLAVSACAQVPREAFTLSGRPEVSFQYSKASEVVGRLGIWCLKHQLVVQQQGEFGLVCGRQAEGGNALAALLLIGGQYSTPPMEYVRFSLIPDPTGIVVQAYQWLELQSGFGQTRMIELNNNRSFNEMQASLQELVQSTLP